MRIGYISVCEPAPDEETNTSIRFMSSTDLTPRSLRTTRILRVCETVPSQENFRLSYFASAGVISWLTAMLSGGSRSAVPSLGATL